MKGEVLHLMELHFFMKGVVEVGVFVCFSSFSLALTRRSRWFRGRLYAIKGLSEKAQSLQHIFNLFNFIHSFTHTIYNFTITSTRVKKSLIEASLRASSPIWASEASRERTRKRAAKPRGTEERRNLLSLPCPPLSRLLSRASRASTFHDIPQMESLLEG